MIKILAIWWEKLGHTDKQTNSIFTNTDILLLMREREQIFHDIGDVGVEWVTGYSRIETKLGFMSTSSLIVNLVFSSTLAM